MENIQIISIVGPTASGKTALAITLAKQLQTEIVSVDSMQIYRHMDIGTAKPTKQEQCETKHHMLDVCNPDESFSVAQFCGQADGIVMQLIANDKIPVLVGGTGLYMDALITGNRFTGLEENQKARTYYQNMAQQQGNDAVFECLHAVDPIAAARLHPNNLKRVIRALEVYESTGMTIDAFNLKNKPSSPKYRAIQIGVCPRDRNVLYQRINTRVTQMFKQGLLEEVRELLRTYTLSETAAQAIGYKELISYFDGGQTLSESAELIAQRSRNYAKRQLTWFHRNSNIKWFYYEETDDFTLVLQQATEYLQMLGVQ